MKEQTNRKMKQIGEKLFLSKIANMVDAPILDYNEDASTFALESGKILVINADMLVISTHGQTAIEEFLWGNTASKIIRYAKCSVLVVKKPKYT